MFGNNGAKMLRKKGSINGRKECWR